MLRWLGRLLGGGGAASGGSTSSSSASALGSSSGAVPPGSARVARDRLSLILQSNTRALNDFSMVDMHREIFQVIQRFLPVELDDVTISVKKDRGLDIFEMQIALPDDVRARQRRPLPPPGGRLGVPGALDAAAAGGALSAAPSGPTTAAAPHAASPAAAAGGEDTPAARARDSS